MTLTDTITDAIASNIKIAAPAAVLFAVWVLYGVLGKRFLGADDDFWPALRGWALPKMDAIADGTGLYAETKARPVERVGVVPRDLDTVERHLEDIGAYRNVLSSLKTNPAGWKQDGAWAIRYGHIRGTGDVLRRLGANRTRIPVDPRWLADMVGRFVQALGDILALRQVDILLFVENRPGGEVVHVYAHDEYNSLNPLTALLHYRGVTLNARKGVRKLTDAFVQHGVPLQDAGK